MRRLRVLYKFLNFKDNLCYFQNKLFTGIGYKIKDGRVVSQTSFEHGENKGSLEDWLFLSENKVMENELQFDDLNSENEFDDVPIKYLGEEYQGIAISFYPNGILKSEKLYEENGILRTYCDWYNNGSFRHLRTVTDSGEIEKKSWWDNGKLSGLSVGRNVEVAFSEENKLRSLKLRQKYTPIMKFQLEADYWLSLRGEYVNDLIFEEIKNLEHVETLNILWTNVSIKSFTKVNWKSLKKVSTEGNKFLSENFMNDFLKSNRGISWNNRGA